jgi:multiple sugar transport system permease protein
MASAELLELPSTSRGILVMPIYVMFQRLKLLDTQIAPISTYIVVKLPIVARLTRDFFAGIPLDLEERAKIDGASKFQVFFTIALPLVRSGLAATFMLVLILNVERVPTRTVPLRRQCADYTGAGGRPEHDSRCAMVVHVRAPNPMAKPPNNEQRLIIAIMIAPVIAIAGLLQKHSARGLLVGAVKG